MKFTKNHNHFVSNFLVMFFFIIFLSGSTQVFSQTKIRGVILNDETGQGIPYASVSFLNSDIGCVTDYKGIFFIESDTDIDTIVINCIGFINDTLEIVNNKYQDFIIYLKTESYTIEEVVVRAGKNPADLLLKKILKGVK